VQVHSSLFFIPALITCRRYWGAQAYASGAELFYKITFDSARNLKLSLPDTVKLLFAQGAQPVGQ
jgi:hypothetical protein